MSSTKEGEDGDPENDSNKRANDGRNSLTLKVEELLQDQDNLKQKDHRDDVSVQEDDEFDVSPPSFSPPFSPPPSPSPLRFSNDRSTSSSQCTSPPPRLRNIFSTSPPSTLLAPSSSKHDAEFVELVSQYVRTVDEELGDTEPTFYKPYWRARKEELQQLSDAIEVAKQLNDEAALLELCSTQAAQKDADNRLKTIVQKAYRGTIRLKKVDYHNFLSIYQKEQSFLREEVQKLRNENKELKAELERQSLTIAAKQKEMKQLQQQFGGVVMREVQNKERELNEYFVEQERQLLEAFTRTLRKEMENKDEDIKKLQSDIDALKLKNVQWITTQSQLVEQNEKLQAQNEKLQNSLKKLQEEYRKLEQANSQLQLECTQLKQSPSPSSGYNSLSDLMKGTVPP